MMGYKPFPTGLLSAIQSPLHCNPLLGIYWSAMPGCQPLHWIGLYWSVVCHKSKVPEISYKKEMFLSSHNFGSLFEDCSLKLGRPIALGHWLGLWLGCIMARSGRHNKVLIPCLGSKRKRKGLETHNPL